MFTTINTLLSPLENSIRKYKKYIGYFFLFLALLSCSFFWIEDSIRESGEKAILVLWIILWMPILARVFGIRLFSVMLPLRKELGILMGTLALVHGFSFLIPYGESAVLFADSKPTFLFFGIVAMWLSIPLTLTSSLWAMRKLGKYWKTLHRVVYVIVLLVILHIALIRGYKYIDF
jgi:DMSO/TMAO reductase YedYZ heme-binding membrane subunit